ncbi:unnamed protein product, partial [Timema podura]|nr:unnamed protein product [Timema podura]
SVPEDFDIKKTVEVVLKKGNWETRRARTMDIDDFLTLRGTLKVQVGDTTGDSIMLMHRLWSAEQEILDGVNNREIEVTEMYLLKGTVDSRQIQQHGLDTHSIMEMMLGRLLMTLASLESEKIRSIDDAMTGTASHWWTLEAKAVTSWIEFQQWFLDKFRFPGIDLVPDCTV